MEAYGKSLSARSGEAAAEREDGGRSVLGGGCNVGEATDARKRWPGRVRQRKRKFNDVEHRGQGCWFWNI